MLDEYKRAAQVARIRAVLRQAAALRAAQPDAAALLLDGALREVAAVWFVAHGEAVPAAAHLLAALERRDWAFAARLRLALRAPHLAARLAHAWELLGAISAHAEPARQNARRAAPHAAPMRRGPRRGCHAAARRKASRCPSRKS